MLPLPLRVVIALGAWCVLGAAPASAQEPPPTPAPPAEQAEARSTGLPSALAWTFNFDAGWGSFGFANSLFDNPKEDVAENLSDQWFEGYVKPALSGVYTFASSSQVHGKISGVGQRTYGSVPAAFGEDVSSFQVEDLAIGWRSGDALGSLGKNAIDVTVGRAQYRVGHGFLVWDGASEGGSRGAYWTNARRAFQFAAVASFTPGPHKVRRLLSRQGRARGGRQRQPDVGHHLRVQPCGRNDARCHVHEVVRASRRQTRT